MLLKFAARNLTRHKIRTTFTLLTISFGCVGMVFVAGFFKDVYRQLENMFINSCSGHMQVFQQGYSQNGRMDPYKYLISNYDEIKALLIKYPEVEYVSPRLEFYGLLAAGENTIAFLGQGVDPRLEQTIPKEIASHVRNLYKDHNEYNGTSVINEGQGLSGQNDFEVILGKGLASGIQVQPQDTVVLLTNTTQGSSNALDMKVRGVFSSSYKDLDDVVLRMPIKTAQKLLNTNSVLGIVIKLRKGFRAEQMQSQFVELFRERHFSLEIKTWKELNDFYAKTVSIFERFHVVMQVVVSLVIILGIYNSFNMTVKERTSEIGTMMALGATRKNVLSLFLTEGALMGIVGGISGTILSILIVGGISSIGIPMPQAPGSTRDWFSHPVVLPEDIAIAFIIAIISAVLSSLWPAFVASRQNVIAALRYRG